MATLKEYHEQIRALFPLIPGKQGWRRPEFVVFGKRQYRGRKRFVVGYSHSRTFAHHMSGSTTERILGYGDTELEAVAMMRARLTNPPR